ncbi:MAG TPA: preprotein translocase subunit SecA [Patescibacteria group bacterium]|jgi:preprotein translocase subunit SecA|nr:preprotein translocase subunit SecA [Patescibacteria group bacterium]
MSFISKILRSAQGDPLAKYSSEIAKINSYADEIAALSDDAIKAEIETYKTELKEITDQDKVFKKLAELRPRVFALTREAAKRALGQFHYDVQLAGGIALADGKIAEMKTGEGKTLTATLPIALYALAGRGAHLVTVNDYLARWQASLMGKVFDHLGLTTASIQHEASFKYDTTYQPEQEEIDRLEGETQGLVLDVKHMRPVSRPEAYAADITYGTNNEYGFDYLRDNMVQQVNQLRQRELFFVIVDEVDSILIDEARTPLIISQPDTDPTDKYVEFSKMVLRLQENEDYNVDEKHKAATLSDEGIDKIQKILNIENIYDTGKGVTTLHHIEQALRAKTLYLKDRDYVTRDGEIIIVDEFTGRLMFGRRYSEGLHQAIEAKEGVKIQQESKTLATITFQNLFRLYGRLAGMTGTAKTEEEEFFKIYQLEVVQIPTNNPMVRGDLSDLIYKNEVGKFQAIAKDVKERHKRGQPVLIGTVSIAKNELLAEHLKKEGIPFELLNAKNHEREAQIIAQAGKFGAVTLATNIAGRGVDILLGGNPVSKEEAEKVREAGGLAVIGTERHESRRIDNQLRGRAGRQGDPGSSQFYVSMADDLMRLFGGERMQSMMETLRIPEDQPVEAKLVSRSIESAQKKIEGLNFDTRKNVLEYDDVLNHQRTVIYKRRRQYLFGHTEQVDVKAQILEMLRDEIEFIVESNFKDAENEPAALKEIFETVNTIYPVAESARATIEEAMQNAASREFVLIDELYAGAAKALDAKEVEIGAEQYTQIMSYMMLQAIDTLWMEHLDTMDHLRDSVRLRGYGQRDPLVEYKREGFELFQRLLAAIDNQVIYSILKVHTHEAPQPQAGGPANIVLSGSDAAASVLGGEPAQAAAVQSIDPNADTDPRAQNIGRNDKCYCGSGLKYKRCGLINSPEHQKNLAK